MPLTNGSMVKVFSVEAPEVLFEDYGSGQLNGGIASVSVEEKFAQTVNLSKGYYVFFTPKGDCKGLYVTNETGTGFEVREMSGGASSACRLTTTLWLTAMDMRMCAYQRPSCRRPVPQYRVSKNQDPDSFLASGVNPQRPERKRGCCHSRAPHVSWHVSRVLFETWGISGKSS